MKFYDRSNELDLFAQEIQQMREQKQSSFIVINGRKRIGKTTLGLEAFRQDDAPGIYLFCAPYAIESELAKLWMGEVCQALNLANHYAANTVNDVLALIFKEAKHRRINLFIDEVQNMLSINPDFFSKLREQWNELTSQGPSHLLMVLSGSATGSVKQLLNESSEPLYSHASACIELTSFPPSVVKEIFRDFVGDPETEGLLALYALTGGVTKYVETLMTKNCFTIDQMLEEVTNPHSYFWHEGQLLLADEFKSDYGNYFSILQKIAHGITKGSELQEGLLVNISGHLRKLETDYGLIAKSLPLFAQSSRGVRYTMTDRFLIFWFHFIQSNQQLIGANDVSELRTRIRSQWENFSQLALKQYFLEAFRESGKYTHVGQWWDRKGENEIDLIAANVNNKTMEIFEIKRNPQKIDLQKLATKAEVFIRNTPEVKGFSYILNGLSLEDL